jgi:hypothetical protein
MDKIHFRGHWLLLLLGLSLSLRAEVQVVKDNPTPNRIRPTLLVLSQGWSAQIPPTGSANAPEFLTTAYPGQKFALGLLAEGPDRDNLFNGVTLQVRLTSTTTGAVEVHDLKPVALRRIKAEGADQALSVLRAGGIAEKDQNFLERTTALVTLAVFQSDWAAPSVDHDEDLQITATISGGASAAALDPVTLNVRPIADWLKDPVPSLQASSQYLNRYHEDLPPGRLLTLLEAIAKVGGLKSPAAFSFFAISYKENAAARNAAIAAFPTLEPQAQSALMFVFRIGGQDIGGLKSKLPAETIAALQAIEPLSDPRELPHFQDPVPVEAVQGIGATMDRCWGGWMATGDQSYLRALTGLLAGAPDFPAFQTWTKEHGGVKGLNSHVAQGLAYQIAGWSIGSFQRTDPHVSDWLNFWEQDPDFPAVLRQEIASLPTNPAFRRN